MEAIGIYQEALITSTWGYTEEESAGIINMNLTLYSNIAAAALKARKWEVVLENCQKALDIKIDSKVLFRLARGYMGLHRYEEALEIAKGESEKNPSDELWSNETKRIEQEIKTTSRKEKEIYGKMFA